MRCNGKVSPRKQKKLQDVSQVLFVEFEKVLIKQSCRYCSHTLTFNFQNISVYVPFSGSSITIKNWENINMKRLNTKKKRKKNYGANFCYYWILGKKKATNTFNINSMVT